MTTASLGFAIDSSQAVSASSDLKNMTDASRRAQEAATGLQRGAKAADSSIGSLRAQASAAAASTTAMARASEVAAQAQTRLATGTGMAQMQTQNLAYQIQDIGTMLAMGQNPFMLLAQQLPQVTQNGGQLNGVMAALRNTVSGLFSPLGLLTTGFVLASSAAISYFTQATDEADTASDALDEQADRIRRVADQWGDAIPALREYANELERIRDETELTAEVQGLSNRAWDEARSILPQLQAEIGAVAGELLRVPGTGQAAADSLRAAFNDADRAAQDLQRAIADNSVQVEDFDRVTAALSSLMANEGVRSSAALQEMIGQLRDRYGEAADEAIRLAEAQAAALAGGPIGGERIAPGKGGRAGTGPRTLSDDDFAGRFGWDEYFRFPRQPRTRQPRRTQAEREAEQAAESYASMIRNSEQFVAAQRLEAQALGMTTEAAQRMRFEQEMLNRAANDNIKLTPEQTAEITKMATAMAAAEAETARLASTNEAWNRAGERSVDLITGLIDGTLSWQDALRGAIPIIQDLIGEMTKANGVGGNGGGSGGFLKSLFGGFGNIIPGSQWSLASAGGIGLYDTGGWTGSGNPSDVAGLVHREEFVVKAGPARRNLPALTAMNNNQPIAAANNGGGGLVYSPNIHIDARGAQQGVGAEIQRALEAYDAGLPDRLQQIERAPRRR